MANYVLKIFSLQTQAFVLLHQHCLTFNHILNNFEQHHHGNSELGFFLSALPTCIGININHLLLLQSQTSLG